MKAAGMPYPGHTEILADLTGAPHHAMMLSNDELQRPAGHDPCVR